MKRSREVVGLPVIELREGTGLGRVSGLVVDPVLRKVVAFEVGEKSLLKSNLQLIPFTRVRNIGSDAITLQDGESPLEEAQEHANFADRKLIGVRLITIGGSLVGTVDDYTFNPATGELGDLAVSVDKARGRIRVPVAAVENFGRDFIILSEEFQMNPLEEPAQESSARQFVQTLEAKAIEYAINREAGHDVLDDDGNAVIRRGEKVTGETIEAARNKNRLAHLLIAAGVGELLDGFDFTKEKLDIGSRRLLEAWQVLRHRSQEWMSRRLDDDRVGPNGELRELWINLQNRLNQSGRELGGNTKEKIKGYVRGKILAYPLYDEQGVLLAGKGDQVTEELINLAEARGRLSNLLFSAAGSDVQSVLDPIKKQLRDVLDDLGKN